MPKADTRTQVAKMLLKASMGEIEKQKMLFALPKMSDDEVKNLQKELKKLEKEEKKRISNRLEADLFQDEKKEHQLKALSQ